MFIVHAHRYKVSVDKKESTSTSMRIAGQRQKCREAHHHHHGPAGAKRSARFETPEGRRIISGKVDVGMTWKPEEQEDNLKAYEAQQQQEQSTFSWQPPPVPAFRMSDQPKGSDTWGSSVYRASRTSEREAVSFDL